MLFFSIEHSQTAYRADFVLYAAALLALAGTLFVWAPAGKAPMIILLTLAGLLNHRGKHAGYFGVTTKLWDRVFRTAKLSL